MKILLLYPQWTINYGIPGHFARKASTWPPLNLAYLAAIAEKAGHAVRIIDGQVEGKTPEDIIRETEEFSPDLIGMTATTTFFHIVADLASQLKKRFPEIPLVVGGPHITMLKDEAFLPCFDYGFVGEADASWPEFLRSYQEGGDLSRVKGILCRTPEGIAYTGPASPVEDVDSIPFPARHLLRSDLYRIGTLQGTKPFATVMTTRGCPFKCIFCSTEVFGARVRKRSPAAVVAEMRAIMEEFGITHFIFLDDTLTLDREHILEICRLITEQGLKVTLDGSTRANLVDEELVAALARAGMIRISFGLESVNPRIRRIMRKEVPLESYTVANRLTNKYGIETLNSCMIGLPGETVETIRETMRFLRESREIKQANLSIAVPYPGTELYRMAKEGEHGLKLVTGDFSKFKRYGSAVMQVGDLSPEDLISLQNDAFVSIYLAPWRIVPMIRKSGWFGLVLMFLRLYRSAKRRIFQRSAPSLFRGNAVTAPGGD
ncbi:MAG TPA: radical SAM protein [bacterium]|nr:radical SAM protein [bacterium]HPJ71749.1 radical SAM protein [bacterium]HPQ65197.1 radical SAM protein [bacterium]